MPLTEPTKKFLRERTHEEQYKTDGKIWKTYLDDKNPRHPLYKERQDIMKRLFLAISKGDPEFRNSKKEEFSSIAQKNEELRDAGKGKEQMPLASLLSHGGRIVLQVPPCGKDEDPDQFLKWVLGGKPEDKIYGKGHHEVKLFDKDVGDTATELGKPVFVRAVATHSLGIKNGEVFEERVTVNLGTLISDSVTEKHMGMNVGLGDVDNAGDDNGHNGHLYMYWKPPTEKSPGALMIGCEGSEPGKTDKFDNPHDFRAKSPEFSPTFGKKFRDLKDSPIHPDIDGLRVKFDDKQLKKIMKKKAEHFKTELLEKTVMKPTMEPYYRAKHVPKMKLPREGYSLVEILKRMGVTKEEQLKDSKTIQPEVRLTENTQKASTSAENKQQQQPPSPGRKRSEAVTSNTSKIGATPTLKKTNQR